MYYTITDASNKILLDGLGRPYLTSDDGLRDGYKQRAEALGVTVLDIDSTVWPPAEGYAVDEAAGTIQRIAKPHPDATWVSGQWVLPRGTLEELCRQRINGQRDAVMMAGFAFGGHTFDSDERSAQKIAGSATIALAAISTATPYAVSWTTADDVDIAMSAQDVLGLVSALGAHVNSAHERARALKAQLSGMTDAALQTLALWRGTDSDPVDPLIALWAGV